VAGKAKENASEAAPVDDAPAESTGKQPETSAAGDKAGHETTTILTTLSARNSLAEKVDLVARC
jgi:hypothetical protein